ncbi:hypothetical protein MSG28_001768 [Choristoneura fumiferana]|uniref:Uncharacterized protein n=1 Tax=Choristoneura fumiferana TaxID=7141 RepID=A0ACC0KW26_CHOFU|nr:hypothetical protein MSG28_001768 [Choristoneura fumiferana]
MDITSCKNLLSFFTGNFSPATRQPSFTERRASPAVCFFTFNKRSKLVFLDSKLTITMAPRTVKAKKPTNADTEAPKKGRGKAKTAEEPEVDVAENEVGDVAPVIEKKSNKRGKKATNGDTNGLEETNEVTEAPPSKKSKKNKIADAPSEEKEANDDKNVAEDEVSNADEVEEDIESNGHTDEAPAGKTGKGRKKPTKKESAASKAKTETKISARGKKNAKPETESEVLEKDEESDEKPKAAPKGRGRKATKKADKEVEPEVPEEQNGSGEEDVKAEPPTKGRKRGPAKPAKERTPENEGEEDAEEEEPMKENKKKETKGKKNQGKKGSGKQTNADEDEVMPVTKKRKFIEKDEKDEVKDEELTEETVSEPKPTKGKRGPKKAAEAAIATEEGPEAGDSNRRRRKAGDEKVPSDETKQKAPPKNKATTDYENIDFSNTSKNAQGKEWNLKIASWNVDGIRAWMSKGGLDYIKYEKPDILCLQETKCAKDKLPDEIANLPGYHAYWQGSDKDGYAGVGIYTTKLAMNVQYGLENEELDNEGRIITAEYEQFYLICTYVPNAGRKLVTLPKRLTWNEEFRKHVKALNEKKPVIICGDMNVAHNEIAGMTELLSDGFVDTYRHLKPQETGAYTFWTYMMNSRAKNVGWR